MPSFVVRWVANFLTGRTQAVSSDGKLSSWLPITQNIVQGSSIGSMLYIIFASYLKLLSATNFLCKYADDKTLMVPENTNISLEDEFRHIMQWSAKNKLTLNFTKTKEMIFHRPGPCRFIVPPPPVGIERVISFKLLGVYLASTLSMENHINYVLLLVNQRLYLINQLRKQGLSAKAREVVFHSLVISRLLYALPAFVGFLSGADIARFNSVFRKSVRWGIIDRMFDFDELSISSQDQLFKRFGTNFNHCLHQLLPELRNTCYMLRQRGHSFSLPVVSRTLFKKSFVVNYLYSHM